MSRGVAGRVFPLLPSVAEKPPDSLCGGNAAAVAVPRRSQKREIPLHNRGPTSRDLNAGFLRELRTCFVWIQWGFSGGREARPPAASSRPPRERALCALRALPATTAWPVTRPLGLPGKFELCQPALAEEYFRPQHIRGGYHHAQGLPHPPFPLPGRILRCAESGPRDRDRDREAWPHAHAGIPPFSPESFSSVEKAIHGPFPKALRASALLKDVRLTSAFFFFFLNVRTVVSLMFTRIFGD